MAALRIAEGQYVKMRSKLILHLEALRSLPGGVADIATLQMSRADLRQVKPAHELPLRNWSHYWMTKTRLKLPVQSSVLLTIVLTDQTQIQQLEPNCLVHHWGLARGSLYSLY